MANTTGVKFGGRRKGSQNKQTAELRKFVTGFLHDNRELIMSDFKALKPFERLTIYERLLKYSLPQLQTTSLDAADGQTITVTVAED